MKKTLVAIVAGMWAGTTTTTLLLMKDLVHEYVMAGIYVGLLIGIGVLSICYLTEEGDS